MATLGIAFLCSIVGIFFFHNVEVCGLTCHPSVGLYDESCIRLSFGHFNTRSSFCILQMIWGVIKFVNFICFLWGLLELSWFDLHFTNCKVMWFSGQKLNQIKLKWKADGLVFFFFLTCILFIFYIFSCQFLHYLYTIFG